MRKNSSVHLKKNNAIILVLYFLCVFYFPFTFGELHLCTTITKLRGDEGENVK
jgi:hypothetical protein